MATLEERIQLLNSSGVISGETGELINKLTGRFYETCGIRLTEENGAALVTHVCMALERLRKNEAVDALDAMTWEDVTCEECYRSACVIADTVFSPLVSLSEDERQFIVMHIIMVIKNLQEEYDRQVLSEG